MSLSLSNKRWHIRETDSRLVTTFSQRYNLSEITARILAGRGIDLDSVENFLSPTLRNLLPDPGGLKDMEEACVRILEAHEKGQTIGIFGDYDVDGATSTALLTRFLTDVGFEVHFHIPDRMKEGYGPNISALKGLKDKGCEVILTLDCGTTSFEAMEHAKSIGLDVIVLDHHAAESKLPEAYAVVNPNRLDETGEVAQQVKTCAAVGISFLFAVALNRALRQKGAFEGRQEPQLMDLLDLVALGTVCDVMPLTGLNRAFVTQGLKVLATRQNLGVTALCDVADLDEKPAAYHLGFILGPRINAGGRVGQSSLGARLLMTKDRTEAREIAEKLDEYNRQRKQIEDDVLQAAARQAEEQESKPSLVLAGEGWHEGVIGIVAGRQKDHWHKPTCVISIEGEQAKGSARSIPGFDMGAFVHRMKHHGLLSQGGGHAMAAGFSLHKNRIAEFHEELNKALEHAACEIDLTPVLKLDGHLSLGAVNPAVAYELETLAPYGMGHASPKFVFGEVVVQYAQIVGSNHVRLTLTQGAGVTVKAVAFRCVGTPLGDALLEGNRVPLDLVGTLKIDQWGGESRAQLVVDDVRRSVEGHMMKEAS